MGWLAAGDAYEVALPDLVVVGDDPDEGNATEAGGPRVVDLDGETVRLSPRTVPFSYSAPATRATSLGHRVRDGAHTVEAAVWIGEPWDDDVSTGPLTWHEPDGGTLRPAEVGSVARSEGMRMAAALYAGRVIDEGTGA